MRNTETVARVYGVKDRFSKKIVNFFFFKIGELNYVSKLMGMMQDRGKVIV